MLLSCKRAAPWAVAATLFSISHLPLRTRGIGQNGSSEAPSGALSPTAFEVPSQSGGFQGVENGVKELQSAVQRDIAEGYLEQSVESGSSQEATVSSGPLGSAPTDSYVPSPESASAFAESGGPEDGTWAKAKERAQPIAQHRSIVPLQEASEGPPSLLSTDGETTTPDSKFSIWNPMKATEPDESQDLKHQGPPEGVVPIPVLDEEADSPMQVADVSQSNYPSQKGRYTSRWLRESTDIRAPSKTPISSRWEYNSPGSGLGGNTTPRTGYKSRFEGGTGYPRTPATPGSRYGSRYESRWERSPPSSDSGRSGTPLYPVPGAGTRYRSRWERIDSDIPTTSPGRGRSTDGNGNIDSRLRPTPRLSDPIIPGLPENGKATDSRKLYRGVLPSPTQDGTSDAESSEGGLTEPIDTTPKKTVCKLTVAGVEIDATYVDSECTGEIHVEYKTKKGPFMRRRLLVTNTNSEPVTVVLKTANAKVSPPVESSGLSSFLQFDGPASFLEGVSEDKAEEVAKGYVEDILKQMRRHVRKEPNAPLDLVISFSSPLDNPQTASEATSFMQTAEGSARIMQTCDELLSVIEEKTNYFCEVLQAVDMVILQFPATADITDDGSVAKVLKKLVSLEGKSILFWELSKPTSLQMVPVETDLPEPPKSLADRPIFLQAKAEVEQQCSAEATAHARLLGGDSPVAARIPRDPDLESRLWGLYAAKCVQAWMHGEKGHKSVLVAVVDSGVSDHGDLDDNGWHNPNEILDGKDNDGNGFIDDLSGWNFSSDSRNIRDMNGHGTHVAGTVGGVANNKAIVGCAPLVSLMKVQQFGASGKGSVGDAVRGVAYALMNGAHIVNNSWGSPDPTRSLQLVIERARYMRDGLGVLIVNAAGNESTNNDIFPFYPAGYDYSHTISVGAYNVDGNRASFSNYGRSSVSFLAPGEKIYSTYPNDGYEFLSGTSMATPHVSGIAALIFGVFVKANSQVTAAEVKDILQATQQELPAAKYITQWGGAPDAMAAVLMARMGGMWCQMECTDMILDLNEKETRAPALLIRGYEQGRYSADIKIEVYDKMGRIKDTKTIPFRLNSSPTPAPNTPSDADAASAFSSYVRTITHANPLCDVQLKYTGTLGEEDSSRTMEIVAIVLGAVSGALLLVLCASVLYFYLKKKTQEDQKKKKEKKTEDENKEAKTEPELQKEQSIPRADTEMFADEL